ncbi:3-keto-5-aminohexanoate cleavage protein [Roseobacter sp. YSTF-M11]|uniref:3-keto-5-aminohexanoate cleavage protein n=1 Tax=Roseobacter insulae TaxID=2859783 RepID=A0A9X1FSX3_9RHOB|nr:3-keto-5-aminohexanoate cleavage protein [Roseobacter insulae]MBW4706313.1 3-keto-5-aminohexanoate cleavage protein [Roseobacter insulae]
MNKIIIEARVNELATRLGNPHVPFLPHEIIADAKACYDEGASVFHYHGRTADGAPEHAPEFYLETNAGIRAQSDILIHPTLGYVANDTDAAGRFAAIEEMMRSPETAPDFAPMDTGSVNVDWWNPQAGRYDTTDLIYKNSTGTLMHFAERIKHHGLKPYLVSWNVSFTRQIEQFLKMGVLSDPAYICFCMTDEIIFAGHPGTEDGLNAHTMFLPRDFQCVWTVVNYKGDLFELTEKIIRDGGHISIGLGDYAYMDGARHMTNAEVIAKVAAQARAMGREPATVSETREILQMPKLRVAA